MAARKPPQGSNIAKISLVIIQHQSITPTASTSKFALETRDTPLHLPPPALSFQVNDRTIAYSGVPFRMLAIVTNTRFQAFREVSIQVIATLIFNSTPYQVLKDNQSFESPIDPQRCLSHPFVITCPAQGVLDVTAVVHFKFENLPHSVTTAERITIMPSLNILYTIRPTAHDFLQVAVQNLFPSRITNVRVRTPGGEGALLSLSLEYQEKASVFFKIARGPSESNSLEFTWSLPFALKCVQTVRLKEKLGEIKPNPIVLTLEGVPQTSPALQQIDVVARIKNMTHDALYGEIVIAKDNQVLLSVGKTDLRFKGLKPDEEQEFPLSFISLYQGYFQFPAFRFELAGGKAFTNEAKAGILIIGYAEQ